MCLSINKISKMGLHSFCIVFFLSVVRLSFQADNLRILSLHSNTEITSRFATTLITSTVLNPDSSPKDVVFRATLPNSAFISNFTMLVDGKVIVGDVDAKAEAKKRFDEAKSKGQTAGLVAKQPRETNIFEISVNVAANDKASFNLTCQEILVRTHGVYKQVVNIAPGQIVDDMKLVVKIRENREITKLLVPRMEGNSGEKTNKELLAAKKNEDVIIKRGSEGEWRTAEITYDLDKSLQEQFSKDGVEGQFVVLYDVDHSNDGGEIQVVNGYFVHFFAPQDLEVGDKSIVFILDKSGSMSGKKIKQLKDAMKLILNDLNEGDVFNIVEFSTNSEEWQKEFVPANAAWKAKAADRIENLNAAGSTDINSALQTGLKLLKNSGSGKLAKVIVFLTDGLPSAGVTDHDTILKNCAKENEGKEINIHAISFGDDADYDLNRKIAAQNAGLARKVYIESDTALQLEGFYNEISSPLLSKLKIKYLNETVEPNSIVLNEDSAIYYEGGEVVVTGRLKEGKFDKDAVTATLAAKVSGHSARGRPVYDIIRPYCPCFCPYPIHATPRGKRHSPPRCRCPRCPHPTPPPIQKDPEPESNPNSFGGFVERMWAYMSIKKLLKQANFGTSDTKEQEKLKKQALDLSLKYNFVTELTSLVVTQDKKKTKLIKSSHEVLSGSSRGGGGGSGGATTLVRLSGGGSALLKYAGPFPAPFPVAGGVGPGAAVDVEEENKDEEGVSSPSALVTTRETVSVPLNVRYVVTDTTNFDKKGGYVKVFQPTLNECALECVATSGCTMVLFDPSLSLEKCFLSFQTKLACSAKDQTTLTERQSKAVAVHCIVET